MSKKELPFYLKTGWIIFMFCINYALGFVFLFLRMKAKKENKYVAVNAQNEELKFFKPGSAYSFKRKALMGLGIFFALASFGCFIEMIEYWGLYELKNFIIYAAISTLFFYLSYRKTQKLNKYQPYLNYLAAYGTDPIYDLAYSIGVSKEQAIKDLSDMIATGMIKASISPDGYIVLDSDPEKIPSSSRYETKFIRCPYCGAPNAIKPGDPRKCAYCDSPLE